MAARQSSKDRPPRWGRSGLREEEAGPSGGGGEARASALVCKKTIGSIKIPDTEKAPVSAQLYEAP